MLYSCNEWIKDGNDLYGPTDTEILAKLWFEIIVICSFLHLCHIMMCCACGRVYVDVFNGIDICWKWIQLLFYELLFCFDVDMKNMHLTALLVLDVRVTQITNPNTFVSTNICLKSSNNCRVFFLPSFSAFLGYQLMFLPISLFMVLRLSFQLIEHHINKALSFDHN